MNWENWIDVSALVVMAVAVIWFVMIALTGMMGRYSISGIFIMIVFLLTILTGLVFFSSQFWPWFVGDEINPMPRGVDIIVFCVLLAHGICITNLALSPQFGQGTFAFKWWVMSMVQGGVWIATKLW